MQVSMRPWGTIFYFAVAALLFFGFIYIGVTREFTTGLDIGFVMVVWIFVLIAMKVGLVRVPPNVRLPGTNLRAAFNVSSLLRAAICVALGCVWSAVASVLISRAQLGDSWIGVVVVFVPQLLILGFFVHYVVDGFKVKVDRR
jgi:hypothetical protein